MMKARKQISLEELFRLYPQLQPATTQEAGQSCEAQGCEGQSMAEMAATSSAEA